MLSGDELTDVLAAAEGLIAAEKPDEDMIKKFITYIFLYQILPDNQGVSELGKNNTWATSLTLPDGSNGGKPLRLRVARDNMLSPQLHVNVATKIVVPNLPASNGMSI